jgi:hypothetical protein
MPYTYDLLECIKTTNPTVTDVTPATYLINVPVGTKTTKEITYSLSDISCKGIVNLNILVPKVGDTVGLASCKCAARAGEMQLKSLLRANKTTQKITARHKDGTENIAPSEIYAFILHEGNGDKIVKQIAINQTGTFTFDATKMKCNRIYYVSYVVGKNLNGLPNAADKCYSVVPKGQAIAWLCPIKNAVAAARENDNNNDIVSENTPTEITIYPNPADDKFFVALPSVKNATLNLFDLQGKILVRKEDMIQYDENYYEVQVSDLPKGIYLLKMMLDGKLEIRKIIVD